MRIRLSFYIKILFLKGKIKIPDCVERNCATCAYLKDGICDYNNENIIVCKHCMNNDLNQSIINSCPDYVQKDQ